MTFTSKIFPALLLLLGVCLQAADTPTADQLWKKTEDAIRLVFNIDSEKPADLGGALKQRISQVDNAAKNFTDAFPQDARRWRIRMFDALTSPARAKLGLTEHGSMEKIVDEVLAAPDADDSAKGLADAIKVLIATQPLTPEDDKGNEEWTRLAEEHLKKYPSLSPSVGPDLNAPIKEKIASLKMIAELKSKPLELKFTAVDGTEVDLAKLRGKVVLLDFWATWCGPCVREVPNVVATYEKLHAKGFEIVGISLDKQKPDLESFTKAQKMTWPQHFDGKGWEGDIATRFGIRSIPAMWLLNKKGMVVSVNARGQLEELVQKYLAD